MKAIIVYDSIYGNTKNIATVIVSVIEKANPGQVQVFPVGQVKPGQLENSELLLIGSPTHGALPTEAIQNLLTQLGAPQQAGARAIAFDTRLTWRFLERWGGFAAEKMAASLIEKGWNLLTKPEGFFVGGLKKGPMKKGEADRAAVWARGLVELVSTE